MGTSRVSSVHSIFLRRLGNRNHVGTNCQLVIGPPVFDHSHATRYYMFMAIKSFKCADTEKLFNRVPVARFSNIASVARRKLEQLDWAGVIGDLRVPPGNRLEALRGDRAGQYSIRINDQFRICFLWHEGAEDVEIVDYH